MAHETLICNVCENPGAIDQATEMQSIPCNVRRFGSQSFTVWRCCNCQSLHCKEAVELDDYYLGYPMRNQRPDFATTQAFHNRLRVLKRHGLSRAHMILDFGSGTSLFVDFLKDKGFDAVGYDPYVPEFADRSVLGRRFDFVISQDVIEHVADPRTALQEHVGLLKSGGVLCIGTPNASEIQLTDEFSMELHQPYHQHILSEKALIDMGNRAGLRAVDVYHRFYYDTLFPMVNTQFIKRYVRKAGGFLDAGFEEPRVGLVLRSPELVFFGLFGYFFRARGSMLGVFRRE